MQDPAAYQQAQRTVERKLRFFTHLAIYVLVNGGLLLSQMSHSGTVHLLFGPVVGWGIGLLFHALSVFLRQPKATWKQRMIEQELNKQ